LSFRVRIGLFSLTPVRIYIKPQRPVYLRTNSNGVEINEYTWNWRTMKSFDDPRFQKATELIRKENPQRRRV
jgi:hypothetical protein